MQLQLNIGLNVGDTLTHSLHDVLDTLPPVWAVKEAHVRRHPVTGELTACIIVSVPAAVDSVGLDLAITHVCHALSQEAIACKLSGIGYVFGPEAAKWGAFNADLWLAVVPENRPALDGEAVAYEVAGREYAAGAYTVTFHAKTLTAYFEHNLLGDERAGGLWFGLGDEHGYCPLELLDYDGVAILPRAVLALLRTLGIDAGRDYE
jgi:hypothetical protein